MGSVIIYTLYCRADSEHIFAALAVLYQAASATMTGTSGPNGPNWKYEADQIKMFQTLTCRCSLFVDDPVSNNWCDRVHEEKVGPILSSSDAWQRTWWRPCLVFLGLFTRRFLLRHLILIALHCLHTTSVPTIQYWGNTNKHKNQPPTLSLCQHIGSAPDFSQQSW